MNKNTLSTGNIAGIGNNNYISNNEGVQIINSENCTINQTLNINGNNKSDNTLQQLLNAFYKLDFSGKVKVMNLIVRLNTKNEVN